MDMEATLRFRGTLVFFGGTLIWFAGSMFFRFTRGSSCFSSAPGGLQQLADTREAEAEAETRAEGREFGSAVAELLAAKAIPFLAPEVLKPEIVQTDI